MSDYRVEVIDPREGLRLGDILDAEFLYSDPLGRVFDVCDNRGMYVAVVEYIHVRVLSAMEILAEAAD